MATMNRWVRRLCLVVMLAMLTIGGACTKFGGRPTPREPRAITETPPPPTVQDNKLK